jgi:hypothetical protein
MRHHRREEAAPRARSAAYAPRPAARHEAALRLQRAAGNQAVAGLAQDVEVPTSGGAPLPTDVRSFMESRFGADFSSVRIHTDAAAATSARSLQARAYTSGEHVVFDQGAYRPASPEGLHTIAHELTHVVQQRAGAVDGTPIGGGLQLSSPDDPFERAAEETAGAVVRSGSAGQAAVDKRGLRHTDRRAVPATAVGAGNLVVQRYVYQRVVEQFTPGSLLYGLARPREDTWVAVKNKLAAIELFKRTLSRSATDPQDLAIFLNQFRAYHNLLSDDDWNQYLQTWFQKTVAATIDELNNAFLGTFGAGGRKLPYGSSAPGAPVPGTAQQALDWRTWLEGKGGKFDLAQQIEGVSIQDANRAMLRIKRACKEGIAWATKAKRQKVFFILDGVDMKAVVEKKKIHFDKQGTRVFAFLNKRDATGDDARDITSAELRSVHRRWHDPQISGGAVTFWKGGNEQPAKPPWVEDPDLWGQYQENRQLRKVMPLRQEIDQQKRGGFALIKEAASLLGNRKWFSGSDAVRIEHFFAYQVPVARDQEKLLKVPKGPHRDERRAVMLRMILSNIRVEVPGQARQENYARAHAAALESRDKLTDNGRHAFSHVHMVDQIWPKP